MSREWLGYFCGVYPFSSSCDFSRGHRQRLELSRRAEPSPESTWAPGCTQHKASEFPCDSCAIMTYLCTYLRLIPLCAALQDMSLTPPWSGFQSSIPVHIWAFISYCQPASACPPFNIHLWCTASVDSLITNNHRYFWTHFPLWLNHFSSTVKSIQSFLSIHHPQLPVSLFWLTFLQCICPHPPPPLEKFWFLT